LPNFEPGDQISMLVLIGRDGSFTTFAGWTKSERPTPHKPRPTEGFETYGVLPRRIGADGSVEVYVYGAVSGTTEEVGRSVTVRTEGDVRVKCAVPSGMDLSIFRVGERVKLYCVSRENRDVLVKIQSAITAG
jgi:hypothetical protein